MRKRNKSLVISCFAGITLSWVILFLMLGGLALLALNGNIGMDKVSYLLAVAQFIAVAAGTYLAAEQGGVEKKKCCLLAGGIFLLSELCTALLLGNGFSCNMLINIVVGLLSDAVVLFLVTKRKTTRRNRRTLAFK